MADGKVELENEAAQSTNALGPLIGDPALHALAHITGGGLTDNLPRVLPQGHRALIDASTWQVPPVFERIRDLAGVAEPEMFRVFNMGIGMVAVVAAEQADALQSRLAGSVRIGVVEGCPDASTAAHVAYQGH